MVKINRLIPFRYLPGSFGLVGNVYLEAEAHYNLSGEDLDRALNSIRNKDDPEKYKKTELDINEKYGIITPYEKQYQNIVDAIPEGQEREIALLELDHKSGKIDKNVFEKGVATIRGEPWIGVVDQGFDPSKGVNGIWFRFDWNEFWIKYLLLNGYSGESEEVVVENWFQDVCDAQRSSREPVSFDPFERNSWA